MHTVLITFWLFWNYFEIIELTVCGKICNSGELFFKSIVVCKKIMVHLSNFFETINILADPSCDDFAG